MRIAVDIDDVLFPWSSRAHVVAQIAGLTNGNVITQWEFHEDYGCTREALFEAIYSAYMNDMFLFQPPVEGARANLQALVDEGHSIHIVTARGFEPDGVGDTVRNDTTSWLHGFKIPYESLTFTQDKTIIRADVLIDDNPKHLYDFLTSGGRSGLLMDSVHNKTAVGLTRVPNLNSAVRLILAIDEWAEEGEAS